MTREEATTYIKEWLKDEYLDSKDRVALTTIIEESEQKPCEDCISRQYLLDNCVVDKVTMPYVPVNKIKNAPPVIPQTKTGRWIEDDSDDFLWKCSECGKRSGFTRYIKPNYNYCPYCGAEMEVRK